ncbi:MAG: xanthine dehydrogenase family protein molybdopterin-binding subunit [Thermoleophilia bacterium]|nr:xanthine dehydrogenase family protein molybdopterin-binding subunit [Thermoleophilia bacterium]
MSAVRERPGRVVGRELVRHDAIEKVAGRTRYAADYGVPGMLHAVVKRSDLPHARLLAVDTSAAEALDGVVCVLTARDVPRNTVWVNVPGQTFEVGALKARMNVLAEGVVRYHGEPVALVAAETEDAALAALDLIEVEYEELPVVTDPERALAPDAPLVHESGNLLASWQIEEGDPEAALARAHAVVEETYETQFVDHAYLEPEAGAAWLDSDGVITVRASTQVIEHFRDVARILRLPDNRVRVIAPYVGGGFGGKEDMTVEPFLALVVHRTGRPVKMVWSRSESLLARQNRHAVRMRYRTGADADGKLVAQQIEILSDGGAYAFLSPLVLLYSATCAQGPYACPNVRIDARTAYTNHTPCSAMRGFGGMQVALAYEGQMDRLAAALGLDPLEIRRRNFVARGDTLAVGQTLDTHVALPELADAVEASLAPPPAPSRPGRLVGRGIACNLQPYGRCVWLNDWASAWVGFELDGTLVVRIGVPDIGGGQASSLVQIASEVIGVEPDAIVIHIGDSALTPLTGTTTATRQLYMSGNAVLQAAGELKEGLRPLAAELLDADPDDVEFAGGAVSASDDPGRRIAFAELIGAAAQRQVAWHRLSIFRAPGGEAWRREGTWRGRVFPDFTYGCHAVDLEVDPETGRVFVLRYLAAHDVGRAINPQSVEGQIEGAVVMGLGYALSERVVFEEGANVTGTFAQYLIPTAVEAPDVEAIVVESGEGLGPFSARGIGEPPIGPPAPAVASALANALGTRLSVLPFTPERVAHAAREVAR